MYVYIYMYVSIYIYLDIYLCIFKAWTIHYSVWGCASPDRREPSGSPGDSNPSAGTERSGGGILELGMGNFSSSICWCFLGSAMIGFKV